MKRGALAISAFIWLVGCGGVASPGQAAGCLPSEVDIGAWQRLGSSLETPAEQYPGLREMFAGTLSGVDPDAPMVFSPGIVALGNIVSVEEARPDGDESGNELQIVELRVGVCREWPVIGTTGTRRRNLVVELLNPSASGESADYYDDQIPGDVGLFFLRNIGAEFALRGESAEDQAANADYWRPINDQGILLNDDGWTYAPLWFEREEDGDPTFPASLNGQPFHLLVAEMGQLQTDGFDDPTLGPDPGDSPEPS